MRAESTRLSLDGGLNWVGERFTDDTRENSVYFKLSQEFRLRVNETTDLAQRLSYSPRPENLSDYLIQGSLTQQQRPDVHHRLERQLLKSSAPDPEKGRP